MTTRTENRLGLPLTAHEVLTREFPELRAMLIEFGASLDRIDRGADAGDARRESRYTQVQEGLTILARPGDGRAERLQMLFSDD